MRKILVFFLAFALVFSLIGCGADGEDRSEDTERVVEDVTEETTEATTKATTEATTEAETVTDASKKDDKDASKTDADEDSKDGIKSASSENESSKADEKDSDKSSSDGIQSESESKADSSDSDSTGISSSTKSSSNGYVIVLDPGHSSIVTGGTEPNGPGSSEMKAADSSGTSGVVSGLTEYQLNLIIATKLETELVNRGYTVILTRYDNNTAISCVERAEIANNNNADAFIRLHADGSDDSSASGAMGICITSSNPYVSSMYSESRILSDDVLNAYVASTGLSSRGVWETDTMTGNNWSEVPCTLLEMGFMTNPNEDSLMADPDFQTKMVTGIANGIDNYFFRD